MQPKAIIGFNVGRSINLNEYLSGAFGLTFLAVPSDNTMIEGLTDSARIARSPFQLTKITRSEGGPPFDAAGHTQIGLDRNKLRVDAASYWSSSTLWQTAAASHFVR